MTLFSLIHARCFFLKSLLIVLMWRLRPYILVMISSLVSSHAKCPNFKFSKQKLIELSISEFEDLPFQNELRYHYQTYMRRFNKIKLGKNGGHDITFNVSPAPFKNTIIYHTDCTGQYYSKLV